MSFDRSSGILLHPTSLPGAYGIGDFGDAAYHFVDFLKESGQSLWQVLPLGPTGYGDSPYQSFSAFAGNLLLISPERLVADKLLSNDDLKDARSFPTDRVDFGRVIKWKFAILHKAFENFKRIENAELRHAFESFCAESASWLDDYALYRALKDFYNDAAWNKWDAAHARRDPAALAHAREKLRAGIEAQRFYQFLFFKQWTCLRAYCREQQVKIIGDVPIFVAHDSVDVWTNPSLFKLDEHGNPRVVAGVPPDYFSRTGQRWGNPLYDWDALRAQDFRWWIERVRHSLQTMDIARLDHFRGFAACWEVPGEDATAERGQWATAPGDELFDALKRALQELPVIAEDLGVITPDVERLRDHYDFPGMRILQYAFGGGSDNKDLPHNYARNTVAYTGTHDNDTAVGWFKARVRQRSRRASTIKDNSATDELEFCLKYLHTNGAEIHWDFIRAAFASIADMVIVPLQDALGLGSEARLNLPASAQGQWTWRFRADALTVALRNRLRELAMLYGRAQT